MRILIVDDSSTMRRIIMNTLNKIGYNDYVEASTGLEAVDKLAEGSIGLVITDWNMPEMSGLDLVKAVRANDHTRHTPLLMVTTNAAKEHINQAIEAGVTDYVVKPFTPDTIREKIQLALKAVQAA